MPVDNNIEVLFDHSSAPKSVKPHGGTRTKYRQDEEPLPIHSDPRVVRGSTTALARKVAMSKKVSATIKSNATRRISVDDFDSATKRPTYVYEVKGHVGKDVDLSSYLISKDDGIPIEKADVDNQTDIFNIRPPSPDYIPRKNGIDVDTQVEDVSELFEFDAESEPIVRVIVGKTLEQALFEVKHEEELKALEIVAEKLQDDLAQEVVWQKQKEEETKAEYLEHKQVVKLREEEKKHEVRVKYMVGGVQAMKQLMDNILDCATEELYETEVWRRPERAEVEDLVMKKSQAQLRAEYESHGAGKRMVDEIVLAAVKLYESKTHVHAPHKDSACVILNIAPKPVVVEDGDDASPAPTPARLEPIKIFDSVTVKDVFNAIKAELKEKELTTELTFEDLYKYFVNLIGRTVAPDGALARFANYMPEELTLEV